MTPLLSPDELEARLRRLGAERYHDRHPFHRRMLEGSLTRGQLQGWALNRYYYQSRIPLKDAAILSRILDPETRRVWRQRLEDHDGGPDGGGGLDRWLVLTDGLGLDRALVTSCENVLPATRFAVDAYVSFCRERSLLEAIASSLTELFAPGTIADRVRALVSAYDFIDAETLAYFKHRPAQARRDTEFALAYVKGNARTAETQHRVLAALAFKCDVLWAQLDALHFAYVEPALRPPGAFRPEEAR